MMKKGMALLLCVFLLGSFALAGCGNSGSSTGNGGGEQEKVTLRFLWWGSDARHEQTLAALDKYMELNPNVKVEAEYSGYEGYEQKLKTQLAGGTAPDLIQVDQPWIYDFSTQDDMFADLNTFKDIIDLSTFDEKFLQDYSVLNNQLQGLPTGSTGMIISYNKSFFQKYNIPEDTQFDWDNLLEIGKRVHDESGGADVLLNAGPNTFLAMFKSYVRQKTGKQFIQDDYTLGFDKPLAVEALGYLEKYLDAGVVQPFAESAPYQDNLDKHPKWFKGEFGMTKNWPSTIPSLQDGVDFEVGALPEIMMKGALTTAVVNRPSQLLSIAKSSKHQEEAAKLMNWLLNDKDAAVILGDVRGVPASSAALDALEGADKLDSVIVDATELALKTSGEPENGITNNAELIKIATDIMQKLGYHKSTPEEAADEIIKELTAKLEEIKSHQ
ncbi:extracellular solute-binding protein [Paenibacillus sepulcri]|uniref:ABC transporter substrate-binding protein n=1 Tax=Paenibacillus sepulcri TaxID=359917 RepID=A0ABS7C0J0_9BACL|nr:ABC transporter substrate-binding protein [Paenibacillus sepulcri]